MIGIRGYGFAYPIRSGRPSYTRSKRLAIVVNVSYTRSMKRNTLYRAIMLVGAVVAAGLLMAQTSWPVFSSQSDEDAAWQEIETWWKNVTPRQISQILKAGAGVDDRGIDNMTPLMFAAAFSGNPEVITALLKAGARVDERDDFETTPLMYAADSTKNPEVITILLNAGAKIGDRDFVGMTPLMYAAENNENPEVTRVLLKAGARVDERHDYDYTPLMCAARENPNPEVIIILLEAGADINDQLSGAGLTPLMCAAKYNTNSGIITVLLKAGANGRIRSKENMTAFDHVKKNDDLKRTEAYWMLNNAQY
jgi:ankyrin repeat protein